MPLDQLAGQPGGLREFRVDSRLEIRNILRALQDAAARVHLNTPQGTVYGTTVWTLDSQAETVSFAVDGDDRPIGPLLDAFEVVAVAYLDSVKVQFDLPELTLVQGPSSATLQAPFPMVIYRFQRRGSFRVKTGLRGGARANLQHPSAPGLALDLRLLDISMGGCGLLLPRDAPPIAEGALLPRVTIDLDPLTRLQATLRLQHLSALGPDAPGVRLGCCFESLAPESERNLRRYIDQSQRRRKFITI